MLASVEDELHLGRQFRLRRLPPGLDVVDGMNPRGGNLLRDGGNRLGGRPLAQDQRDPVPSEGCGKRGEAVMKPPALRAAHPPFARSFVIQDIERNDRASFGRCRERGLIGETKILAKPDEGRFGRHTG